MPIDFYLAGFDFEISSNMIVNGDMEVDSYWQGTGDQSSFWQSSAYAYDGGYSYAYTVDSTAFIDALISFGNVVSGDIQRVFSIADNNDFILYNTTPDEIIVFNGLSNQEKFRFSSPCSNTITAMSVYSGDLFLACSSSDIIQGPDYHDSQIYRMNGISSEVNTILTIAPGAITGMTFDSSGNLITDHQGWFYYFSYSQKKYLYKWAAFSSSIVSSFQYYDVTSFYGSGATIAGLESDLIDSDLWLHNTANNTVVKFDNFSGDPLETHSFSGTLPGGGELSDFKFYQDSYCAFLEEYSSNSGDTAWLHIVGKWGWGYPNYSDRSFLYHSGENIQLEQQSNYVINFNFYLVQGTYNVRVNLRRGDDSGYHYQSNVLRNTGGKWTNHTLPFQCSYTDSQSVVEMTVEGSGIFEGYLDKVRVSEPDHYEQSGVIQIYPVDGYIKTNVQERSEHRTKGGGLYSFKWGDYTKFEVPLEYVPNSKAQLINQWWQNDSLLYFKVFSGNTWEVNTVGITNKNAPIDKRQKPYTDKFSGKIILEASSGLGAIRDISGGLLALSFTVNPVIVAPRNATASTSTIQFIYAIRAVTISVT